MYGKSLTGSGIKLPKQMKNKVSLTVCWMRQVAQPVVKAYREVFDHAFASEGDVQVFEVRWHGSTGRAAGCSRGALGADEAPTGYSFPTAMTVSRPSDGRSLSAHNLPAPDGALTKGVGVALLPVM